MRRFNSLTRGRASCYSERAVVGHLEVYFPVVQHAIRHPPKLPVVVADGVRQAIADGVYRPGERLPPENELAQAWGVSRTTLRQAIAVLEQEGMVSRKHGIGTFVAPPGALLRNDINSNFGVTHLIEAAGWRPGTRDMQVREEQANGRVLELLSLPPGSRVLIIERTRTADDRPLVCATDILPLNLLEERGVDTTAALNFLRTSESLYRAVASMGVVIHHGLAELRPAVATQELAARLKVPLDALLLHIEQVDYTSHGQPILLSHEYHVADAFSVTVYRQGPGSRG